MGAAVVRVEVKMRGHPQVGLDRRRRPSHYADFHRAKKRHELDVYYTALRHAEHRANLKHEYERLNSLIHHKVARADPEDIPILLTQRRKILAEQIHQTLPR